MFRVVLATGTATTELLAQPGTAATKTSPTVRHSTHSFAFQSSLCSLVQLHVIAVSIGRKHSPGALPDCGEALQRMLRSVIGDAGASVQLLVPDDPPLRDHRVDRSEARSAAEVQTSLHRPI